MVGYSVGDMCGRFARKSTQEVLAEWFDLELEEVPWFASSYNAAPQSIQPVVRLNRNSGRREAALLRWGLVPFWAKDAKSAISTINARAEEAATKPAFREALKMRRSLVPADAYSSGGAWALKPSALSPSHWPPVNRMPSPDYGRLGSRQRALCLKPSPS